MTAVSVESMLAGLRQSAERQRNLICKNFDDCSYCKMGVHHPNTLVIHHQAEYLDERAYIEAAYPMEDPNQADLCTARWRSTTYSHDAGEICGKLAEETFGDISVCGWHANRMRSWIRELAAERIREERKRVAAEACERREAAEKAKQERLKPLVYFVERDGFCKIGYTTNFNKRKQDISKGSCLIEGMTVGPVRTLATIPGAGEDSEKWHHCRFAHLRIGGEWFLLDDELRTYIGGLKGCVAPELRLQAAS